MSDGPKRTASDTHPIVIPPEVLARFRHESSRPTATEEDVRRAIAGTVPDAVECPGCLGLGRTSVSRARLLEDAITSAQAVVTCPVRAPGLPQIDDEEDPTQVD